VKAPGATKVAAIVARIGPLVTHLERFPPSSPIVRVSRADWQTLSAYPKVAAGAGFARDRDDGLKYRGLTILPDVSRA